MKLYDVMRFMPESCEITINDTVFDTEFYMYPVEDYSTDIWDQAMIELSKALDIVKGDHERIVCNVYDTVERALESGKLKGIIKDGCDTDDIMEDINAIISGYVSDDFITKFCHALLEGSEEDA